MKTATSVYLFAFLATTAHAFAPSPFFGRSLPATTTLFSSEPEDEEDGLDLNLEEMFEMFDAAAKNEDFDKAIKKVKGDN